MDGKLSVFVDESGSIPKGICNSNECFIITMLFVENEAKVKKIFKKSRLAIAKKSDHLYKKLCETHEIKGSELSEAKKYQIYKLLQEKCSNDYELGIIVLNCSESNENFRSVSSRTFNFLIKDFLENSFTKYSGRNNCDTLCFIIDERNVAPQAKHTLEEYLNTELNLQLRTFKDDITVNYSDSKKYLLLQLADFISNTYYRTLKKKDKDGIKNIELFKNNLCNGKVFSFPLHY